MAFFSTYRLEFGGQGRCQLGKEWLFWHGECKGRHLPKGWSLLLHKLPVERGELMLGSDERLVLKTYQWELQVTWECVGLSENRYTFALERCFLDEEIGWALVSFDLSESNCSWSPTMLANSCGDRCCFAGNLLGVKILFRRLLRALLCDGLWAGHLQINIIANVLFYFKSLI